MNIYRDVWIACNGLENKTTFLQQNNIPFRKISSLLRPSLSCLKMLQIILTPSVPEPISEMLNASPALFAVDIFSLELSGRWQNKLDFDSKNVLGVNSRGDQRSLRVSTVSG